MKYPKAIAKGILLLVCAVIIGTTIFSAVRYCYYFYWLNFQDISFSTALLMPYVFGGYSLLFLIPLYIAAIQRQPLISKNLIALLAGLAWCPLQIVNPLSYAASSVPEQLLSIMTTAVAAIIFSVGIALLTNILHRK